MGSDAARESYISCCGGLYLWIYQPSTVVVCKQVRPILLAHDLEISCFQSSATWFKPSHKLKWPLLPSQALGSLPTPLK